MTTENTDAATRILTKTIRKLAEQLAEADQAMGIQRAIYRELLEEQDAVREALGTPLADVVAAARMRMSAMGELGRDVAELRQKLAELEPMPDYGARIDQALAVLPSSIAAEVDFAPIAEARRILRGES